jgi:hypothetical protein
MVTKEEVVTKEEMVVVAKGKLCEGADGQGEMQDARRR